MPLEPLECHLQRWQESLWPECDVPLPQSQLASNEAVLLVDATNAFNRLNQNVVLLNVNKKCPPLAKVLINTYKHNPQLYVDGETLFSKEGTTQGDLLAMPMYAIGILPLIL